MGDLSLQILGSKQIIYRVCHHMNDIGNLNLFGDRIYPSKWKIIIFAIKNRLLNKHNFLDMGGTLKPSLYKIYSTGSIRCIPGERISAGFHITTCQGSYYLT